MPRLKLENINNEASKKNYDMVYSNQKKIENLAKPSAAAPVGLRHAKVSMDL